MAGARRGIIVALMLTLLVRCGPWAVAPAGRPPAPKSGLEYFGFALIDCGWDDPHDRAITTNYVNEVAGFTNIGQMCVDSPDASLHTRVRTFYRAGLKAILYIEPILFDAIEDASSPSGVRIVLRQDAEARWAGFVKRNGDVLTPTYVAALYVVDEPAWNSVAPMDFVRALRIVKRSLPAIPTLAIEAYPMVGQIMVPDELDWIGFDRYDSVDPRTDGAWLADLETVRAARSRPSQRIVIVASTQWLPYYQTDAGILPEDMGIVAERYYQVAASDPDIVALLGYLWPGGFDDSSQLGARNLPQPAQQSLRDIGRRILDK